MNEAFMQNYLNRNIYKVSNPPGGQSSITLAWDDTSEKYPKSKSFRNKNTRREEFQNSKPNIYENKSMTFENKSMAYGDKKSTFIDNRRFAPQTENSRLRDNASFVEGINNYGEKKNSYDKYHYKDYDSSKAANYAPQRLTKNLSTPFSYNKKDYAQYMNPSFIELRRNQFPSNDFSIQNWENSSKLLEEELKYYQQKNRLLKEKLYGGYNNEEALRRFQPDFHDRIKRISNQSEELQIAIRDREKNKIYM